MAPSSPYFGDSDVSTLRQRLLRPPTCALRALVRHIPVSSAMATSAIVSVKLSRLALTFYLLYFFFLVQVVAYDAGFLSLFNDQSVCAMSSDGCDDACLLAACCTDWITNGPDPVPPVSLQSGAVVDCADVVCYVPTFVRWRATEGTAEESLATTCAPCRSPEAYIFARRFGAHGFGHVAFGFKLPFRIRGARKSEWNFSH